jgi:thiol-disulfide isomerase/thioredoxin
MFKWFFIAVVILLLYIVFVDASAFTATVPGIKLTPTPLIKLTTPKFLQRSTDSSGNTRDVSGDIISDASGNIRDASGNVRDILNEYNIKPGNTLIFFAPWCGYCKKAMPVFKAAKKRAENGAIILIDGDANPELVKRFNVKKYPTIMKNGRIYNGPMKRKRIVKFSRS